MLSRVRTLFGLFARRSSVAGCAAMLLASGLGTGCQGPPEGGGSDDLFAEAASPLTISKFQGWQQVPGGDVRSPPGVTMRATNSVDLFARGTDGNLYNNFGFLVSGTWNWFGYVSVGGGTIVNGAAATPFDFNGTNMAVAARRLINGVNVASVNVCVAQPNESCSFAGWTNIPNSNLNYDPAIVTFPISFHKYLYVIAADTNNTTRFIRNEVTNGYNSANWETWGTIPNGVVNANLAATVNGSTLYVVGRGTDNHFYLNKTTDGATWSGWTAVTNQTFSSGPALSSWSGGHLDVFGAVAIPGANPMYNSTSTDGGATWGTPQSVGGNLVGAPAAWSPAVGSIQTFGTGTDVNPTHVYRNIYQE